ncbi:type II/IV secretion system protein [bacterium]|nr:MAG: type II/IV secretion system protein [bacterium]
MVDRSADKQSVPESQAFGAGAAPEINLKETKIEPDVIEKIPAKFVWHYKFMPVQLEGDVLTVATASPDNVLRDDLSQFLGFKVKMARASEADILEAIKKFYGVGAETVEKILEEESVSGEGLETAGLEEIKDEDIAKLAEEPGVIRLVNQILLEANQKNATDIHIEPYPEKLKLRYRIDGILYDARVPQNIARFLPAIISRVKIMSGLNIVERRLPQDGRAKIKIKNEIFDLRISTMPTPYGESIVIRILPTAMLFSLEKLGFSDKDLKTFEELIKKPHGVIFVTGPTGSGKTTTLYTALSKIKEENKGAKILTIEDPIEYELEGITQTQVNPEIGLNFARGLRSMLRHDPDIMMVGEVRDFETAEIAIRMALTGHLLFSTLHTNDAASGVARLLDIGVEPYLIASSVQAFIAQRLVRVVCEKCKGKGCEACNSTGYKGRSAMFEILPVDEAIKKLITEKAPAGQIKKKAVLQGMKTLWEDGQEKIKEGITTQEEVLRVTQEKE